MVDNGLYDEGYFVFLSPELNCQAQAAANAYTSHLTPTAEGKVRFLSLTLEDAIKKIRLTDPNHADALYRRYCDFWLVDGEMELSAPLFGALRKTEKSAPAESSVSAAGLALPAAEAPRKRRRRKP
jgi:hypothetical protein